VIQVTSAEAQDGKTTLAANMALAMAHAGKRVLLIDADLRCPKVHQLFRLRHEIGPSDVVTGEIQFENAVQTCDIEGLSLLTAGLTPANPSELLGGSAFEELLDGWRTQYDFVIIDTPPLMAVSDPCVVASRVDALILVVRVGKNKLNTLHRACELLSTLGITLLGAVVNNVEPQKNAAYGGSYHDGYLPKSGKNQKVGQAQLSTRATDSSPIMMGSAKSERATVTQN
jgi:succinoglycan biosynthesis transport protein ExoP